MNVHARPLGITALVVHARTVPSEERERFAASAAAVAGDPRIMVLRTCHRVELYAAIDPPGAVAAVAAAPGEADGSPGTPPDAPSLPELPPGGLRLHDHEAVRHLFIVAAGLDSVVVGEDQILHQLRECLSERHLAGFETTDTAFLANDRARLPDERAGELSPVLDRMFQLALHVGRQSRSWREGPPRSLADVAIDRIAAIAGPLAGRRLLVVGAGRMSRLTALAAARRGIHVAVTNRTPEHAQALAADVDGAAVPFGAVPGRLAGVVAAVGGQWTLESDAQQALVDGDVPVVDLSSPPSIGLALREQLGSHFVSVDDIARGPADVLRERVRARMERLLGEAEAELAAWVGGRGAVGAIRLLTEHAEMRRSAEVERLLRRLPDLAEHDRELVEQMSHRLVSGLLHAPLSSLRDDLTGERERAARDLFSL